MANKYFGLNGPGQNPVKMGSALPAAVQHNPAAQGGPTHANVKKPSDQRFRSFAERYVIARAHYFRQEPELLLEDSWSCILDAKRLYAMIARTGQNIEPEDGVF